MVLLYVYDLRDAAGGGDGRGEGELNEEGTGYSPISKNIQGLSFIIISEMILHHFQNDTKWGRQSWPRYGVVYMPALSPPLRIISKMILYHFQNDTKWG